MLSQKGVAGHAQYVRSSASGDGPIQSFVYSVDGVEVSIRNVEFPGASAAHLPSLQAVARKEIEQGEYGRSRLAIVARTALRPVYLKQGYLKARFGEAQAVLVGSSPQETMVDAKLPVEEGRQYKLEKIAWTSNTIFPAQELQSLIHLPVGQPANTLQLEQDFAGVRRLYGSRGYVKAVLEPRPFFKDDEGTVAYVIEVKEGDIYRMGDVDIEGLDDKATARLREDWKLREGDPYDSSYAKKFLDQSAPDLPPRTKWKITVHESVNDKDRTVDVTLRFAPAKEGLP
jgi:outer membrane translocation and assembly module TamA